MSGVSLSLAGRSGAQRQAAHEAFERDRQVRLEAVKAEQTLREQQRRVALAELPKAVNAPATSLPRGPQARVQTAEGTPAAARTQQGSPAPPESAPEPSQGDYEARRREFFRRMGSRRKAELEEQEQRKAEAAKERADSPAPAQAPPAASPANDSDAPAPSKPDYAARREAFMSRHRRKPRIEAPKRDVSQTAKDGPQMRAEVEPLSTPGQTPEATQEPPEAKRTPTYEERRSAFMQREAEEPEPDEGPELSGP